MAITVNNYAGEGYRADVGQTDGNEVIYLLNPSQRYVIDCINTAAGTASLKVATGADVPADFSAMSLANDGTQTSNFSREILGCSFVGLDVGTGTWTTKIRRV